MIKVKLVDKDQELKFMHDMMHMWAECKKDIRNSIFYLTEEQYEFAKKYYIIELIQ